MARIVLISPYLKGGQNAAKLAQRTRYVATRPGVEPLSDERSTLPATKKQRDFITRLLKSFPSCWELIEYEEYLDHPTQGNASAFIQQVREDYMEALDQKENFIDYISHRPGVQKDGEHGLWDANGKVKNLARAVREVAEHTGNVWTPVIALRREDAERLGYDSAENWQALSRVHSSAIFSLHVDSAEFRFCTIQLSLKNSHLLKHIFEYRSTFRHSCCFLIYFFKEAYAIIKSRISLANVIITPPASVRNPFALWLGSWLFKDRPTCTTPNPSKIKPIARIREKIKVDRLLITDSGSPAANAVVAPTVTVSTSAI